MSTIWAGIYPTQGELDRMLKAELYKTCMELKERCEDLEEELEEKEDEVGSMEKQLDKAETELNQVVKLPGDKLSDQLKGKFLMEQFDKYTEDELRQLLTR